MSSDTLQTPAPPRLFALDARQHAMLDAMGVRLEWLSELQRRAARDAAPAEAPADRTVAAPEVEDAPAPARRVEPPATAAAPAPRPAPARAAAIAPPAPPAPSAPPALTPATALLPGEQVLLADAPRLLHGPADASGGWLVVADMAPDALGHHDADPRSGDEGRLLDAMLRALQLAAAAVPVHLVRLHRGVAPQPSVPDLPRPWDEAFPGAAAALAPRVVLALGPLSAQALLRREGPIGKLRGQAEVLPDLGGARLVASYHPAFLLKNAPAKAKAWADLCLAAALFDAAAAERKA